MLGWTRGLSTESLRALRGIGLDFVFSSLPWWNFRADWLWREREELARIGGVIAPVEAPFGSRVAAQMSDAHSGGRSTPFTPVCGGLW